MDAARSCSQCGYLADPSDHVCRLCGMPLLGAARSASLFDDPPPAPPRSVDPPPPPPPAYGQPLYPYPPVAWGPKTNGMAIASMVLGIVWVWGITSILALIFGIIARRQIDESNGLETGRGFAIAGIVLGIIGIVGAILWILLIVIGLLAASSISVTSTS
jgi:hypothetical protein